MIRIFSFLKAWSFLWEKYELFNLGVQNAVIFLWCLDILSFECLENLRFVIGCVTSR